MYIGTNKNARIQKHKDARVRRYMNAGMHIYIPIYHILLSIYIYIPKKIVKICEDRISIDIL